MATAKLARVDRRHLIAAALSIAAFMATAAAGCAIIRAQPADELPGGSISGVVTGPSGPIAGATVTVTPGDNSYHVAQSDEHGYYSLTALLAGPASVQVEAAGYQPLDAAVRILADATVTENVSLTPQ